MLETPDTNRRLTWSGSYPSTLSPSTLPGPSTASAAADCCNLPSDKALSPAPAVGSILCIAAAPAPVVLLLPEVLPPGLLTDRRLKKLLVPPLELRLLPLVLLSLLLSATLSAVARRERGRCGGLVVPAVLLLKVSVDRAPGEVSRSLTSPSCSTSVQAPRGGESSCAKLVSCPMQVTSEAMTVGGTPELCQCHPSHCQSILCGVAHLVPAESISDHKVSTAISLSQNTSRDKSNNSTEIATSKLCMKSCRHAKTLSTLPLESTPSDHTCTSKPATPV